MASAAPQQNTPSKMTPRQAFFECLEMAEIGRDQVKIIKTKKRGDYDVELEVLGIQFHGRSHVSFDYSLDLACEVALKKEPRLTTRSWLVRKSQDVDWQLDEDHDFTDGPAYALSVKQRTGEKYPALPFDYGQTDDDDEDDVDDEEDDEDDEEDDEEDEEDDDFDNKKKYKPDYTFKSHGMWVDVYDDVWIVQQA